MTWLKMTQTIVMLKSCVDQRWHYTVYSFEIVFYVFLPILWKIRVILKWTVEITSIARLVECHHYEVTLGIGNN